MTTNTVRSVKQHFGGSKFLPYLTIRMTHNSTQSYKAHSHSELSVGIIESGTTLLSMLEKQFTLKKGDIVLIEPNIVHACNPDKAQPRSYQMLYIDNKWCCNVLSKLYGYEVKKFRCDLNILIESESCSKLSELIFTLSKYDVHSNAIKVERYLLDLVSRYCSPESEREDQSELALKLKNRFLEDTARWPSLEVISKEFGKPKETLIRVFKRRYGITPKSFLNNSRVEKSKTLLKHGMSIVNAAVEVGFSDQSQFHRAFVNYTASTPRQYQQLSSIFDNKS